MRTILSLAALAGAALMVVTPKVQPAPSERINFMRSPALVMPQKTSSAPSSSAGTAIVAREKDGHYWAEARVNGRKLKLLVDTGASSVVLTDKDAQRIGIRTKALRYNGTATTANGQVRTAQITLEKMKIGGVQVEYVPAIVTQGELDTSLLGMSFLGALDSFEFKGEQLILRE